MSIIRRIWVRLIWRFLLFTPTYSTFLNYSPAMLRPMAVRYCFQFISTDYYIRFYTALRLGASSSNQIQLQNTVF